MIVISCNINNGHLVQLSVNGHAGSDLESRIICSAVSCLTKTVCNMAMRLKGITAVCSAPKPGDVTMKVDNIDNCLDERFSGISDFFVYGLLDIKEEYSNAVQIKINNKEWYNGSQKRWW